MVPSVLERVTRSRPDLDGVMEAERDRDPVLSARLCRAAASSERYRRLRPFSASRGCDFTFYQSPYHCRVSPSHTQNHSLFFFAPMQSLTAE